MPLYEYQCVSCGDRTEVLQKFSDPPYAHCAKCGGDMKKLQSSPAIQFKGSGFYKTDYASGSGSKPAASSASSESSSSASSSTSSSTETKSEAKTEKKSSD